MRGFSLSLCAVFLFTACGKNSVNQNDYPVGLFPSDSGKQLVDAATVTCANNQDCPEAVGLLTFFNSRGAGMCTAFLIAPDLALTNSHCISDEVRQKPELASQVMKLMFPTTLTRSEQTVAISDVLQYSDISFSTPSAVGKKPDYALLRLKNAISERLPLVLSQDGFADELPFQMYSVTPMSKYAIIGLLEVKKCQTMMHSAAQPSYSNPFTSIVSFSDCQVKHGNSGSPMVDFSGKVRGIVHAGYEDSSTIAKNFGMARGDPLSLGTNLACVEIPGFQKVTQNECLKLPPQIGLAEGMNTIFSNADEKALEMELTKKIEEAFERWLKYGRDTSPVEWILTMRKANSKNYVQPEPKCFLRNRLNSSTGDSFIATPPTWELAITFDSKFRVSAKIENVFEFDRSRGMVTARFSRSALKEFKKADLTYQSDMFGEKQLKSLPYCQ